MEKKIRMTEVAHIILFVSISGVFASPFSGSLQTWDQLFISHPSHDNYFIIIFLLKLQSDIF